MRGIFDFFDNMIKINYIILKKRRILVMKKLLWLFLIVIMLFIIVSCAKDDSGNISGGDAGGQDSTAEEDRKESSEAKKILPGLEPRDFGGYEFTFLVNGPGMGAGWYVPQDLVEESEYINYAEVLRDATYRRNLMLEETYNFKIKMVPDDNLPATLKKAVAADDLTYDAAYGSWFYFPALTSGYLKDLLSLPHLDFSKPWWAADCVRDLTVGGRLFIIAGDMLQYSYTGSACVFFSKKLIEDNALEIPYNIVRSGKWTLDRMFEMGREVILDVNGDGKYDGDDVIGVVFEDKFYEGLYLATGQSTVEEKNGVLEITVNHPRTTAFIDKMIDYVKTNDGTFFQTEKLRVESGVLHSYQQMRYNFNEDRNLFMVSQLSATYSDLRLKETPYGILPLPKLDESQGEYYSYLPGDNHVLAVPMNVKNAEDTGYILEAIAAESKYTTKIAAYDNILIIRQMRDVESEEMINIINANRRFDLGSMFKWAGIDQLVPNVVKGGNNNFASQYESIADKARLEMEKTMEEMKKTE